MLTAEDRMTRAVDKALEIVVQAIDTAIGIALKGESLDSVLARSPRLQHYQASLFVSAANCRSTMQCVAIDNADRLGLEASELHKLNDFRKAIVHKHPTARVRQVGLDPVVTQQEMARSIRLLQAMGDHWRGRLVEHHLQHLRAGASAQWTPPTGDAVAEPANEVTLPPKEATRSKQPALKPSPDLSDDRRANRVDQRTAARRVPERAPLRIARRRRGNLDFVAERLRCIACTQRPRHAAPHGVC
jgi:hypothetical protein